jgi:hypothetical protein
MLKRLLREPLIHFVVVALAIFAVYGLAGRWKEEEPDRIVVTSAKIEQLSSLFTSTWQRPPTAEEITGLIDDYVKEEIYYREAKKLGLDTDDTVVRRRLRLKMEYLNEAAAGALTASEAELKAYLKAHPEKFEIDPMMAFQQVFLNPQRRGDKIDADAGMILVSLKRNPQRDPASFGDTTLLPAGMPLTPKTEIARTFGPEFAEALDKTPAGEWIGPIASGLGYHIVRVSERKPGRVPELAEARDQVLREWSNDKRMEIDESTFNELLKRYRVVIDGGAAKEIAAP